MSSEYEVTIAGDDDYVTLLRGCNSSQLSKVQSHVGDDNASAPSEKEAIEQVGEVPCFGTLIEFTTDRDVAVRFGTGGYVIEIKIQKKYLTKGSVSEGGWICRSTAPFTLLGSEKGRAFRF